jgi:hypothetical protein
MKKSVISLTTLAIVAAMLVSACSVATNILPNQTSNLLNTVKSASAQATPAPSCPIAVCWLHMNRLSQGFTTK